MGYFKKFPLLIASLAVLLAVGCSDNEEAREEADAMDQRTEEAIEQDPATELDTQTTEGQQQQQAQVIPPPENVSEPPQDAKKSDNGVSYIVLEDRSTEVSPTSADVVTVHYTGWTTDGKMFDSSVARGEPATFPLGALIPGWQEAVPLMTVGDKYRFWIPGNLAYDSSNRPGAPKGTLVFDIELIDVQQSSGENEAVPAEGDAN